MKWSPNRTKTEAEDKRLLWLIIRKIANAESVATALIRNKYCKDIVVDSLRRMLHQEIDSAIDMIEKIEKVYPVMNDGMSVTYNDINTDGLLKEVNDMIDEYLNESN